MLYNKDGEQHDLQPTRSYCWYEYATVEGEDKPRLLVPHADEHQYEFQIDFCWPTIKEAYEFLVEWELLEEALEEKWVLCWEECVPVTIAGEVSAPNSFNEVRKIVTSTVSIELFHVMLDLMGALEAHAAQDTTAYISAKRLLDEIDSKCGPLIQEILDIPKVQT
jgi:hypothetical protein